MKLRAFGHPRVARTWHTVDLVTLVQLQTGGLRHHLYRLLYAAPRLQYTTTFCHWTSARGLGLAVCRRMPVKSCSPTGRSFAGMIGVTKFLLTKFRGV